MKKNRFFLTNQKGIFYKIQKNFSKSITITFMIFSMGNSISLARTHLPLIINSPLDAFQIALKSNPELKEKNWAILSFRALEKKAKKAVLPTFEFLSFVAPIYKVQVDPNNIYDFQKDYYSWGPSYNFQGSFIQPIYTFGRFTEGKKAAKWGVRVKIAEKQTKVNEIRKNIAKYYWGYQLSLSLLQLIKETARELKKILGKAESEYEKGSGKISLGDLSKLRLFSNEIEKEKKTIITKKKLTLHALKRITGIAESIPMEIKKTPLRFLKGSIKPLSFYTGYAMVHRPELSQLNAGIKALAALAKLTEKENYPIIAIAGKLNASYTPIRKELNNPYFYDPYNNLEGGIGIGIKWRFDSGKTSALREKKGYDLKALQARQKYAKISIPLETKKTYLELKDSIDQAKISRRSLRIARKWAINSKLEFDSGILEARDLIEGLAAYTKSRIIYQKSLYEVYNKLAELSKCIGNNTIFIERKK